MGLNKVCIMVSGGLDSFVSIKYAKSLGLEPYPVFISFGQPYVEKEREALATLDVKYKEVKVDGWLQTEITTDNWIIPGRNLLFAVIGASFADRVWLGALSGEQHAFAREHDKSHKFFREATNLLSYIFEIQQSKTIIETPFGHFTKTKVVQWALAHGIGEEKLKLTSSCYHGKLHNCGICGTCFKRWIAMINNDIFELYESKPWENLYARRTSVEMWNAWKEKSYSHYSWGRISETFRALQKVIKLDYYIEESRKLLTGI